MGQVADAERAVVELAWIGLGPRNDIVERLEPRGGTDYSAQRVGNSLGDRGEIAKRVVGQFLVDELVPRQRAHRSIDQRVAVRIRSSDGLHSDDGIGARAVLHDSLLAPELAHFLRENARL